MRFVFFMLTPFSFNVARDYLMATALAAQGDKVVVVGCDGQPRCMVQVGLPPSADVADVCRSCTNGVILLSQKAFASFQGETEGVVISRLIDTAQRDALWQHVDSLPDENLLNLAIADMPLGQWVTDNLRLEYFGEQWQRLPNWPDLARKWLKGAIQATLAAERVIRVVQPDTLILLNGLPVAERSVRGIAQRFGVRCLTYEDGQRPHTLVVRETTPAPRYDFSDEWQQWRNEPLTSVEADRLDRFFHRRWFRSSQADYVFSTATSADPADVLKGLGLPEDRPLVTAFSNVLADTAVFGSDQAYPSLIAWANDVIRYAAMHPEISLIVRVHPAEQTLSLNREGETVTTQDPVGATLRETWPEMPANVRIVEADDPISSYDLLRLSRLALVYVSSVGMEAAAMGLPVVNAGHGHYSDAGFTWNLRQAEDFFPLLERLLANPETPPDAQELARRYMYLWYFRANLEIPALRDLRAMETGPDGATGYFEGYSNFRDIVATDEPTLRHLVRHLRGEVPFVLPPAEWRRLGTPEHASPSHNDALPANGREELQALYRDVARHAGPGAAR